MIRPGAAMFLALIRGRAGAIHNDPRGARWRSSR